jgi:hypothetical protein
MVTCGHVYFLNLPLAGKEKLVVPAFVTSDGRVRFFVINTQRTEFQIDKFADHVLPLRRAANSSFLTHDSWLTCHEVVGGWKVEEVDAVNGCYRGPLDQATIAAVRTLIEGSRLYSAIEKISILEQWPH